MVSTKNKPFTNIQKNPSLLGFGCMRFPKLSPDLPDIDESLAEQMIDIAYQSGVNYFDTAYPYHQGMSEPFLGKVMQKYPRNSYFLATKMPGWELKDVNDAIRIFNQQLSHLKTEYIDFYLCHALSKNGFEIYKNKQMMDFLFRMKKEGKIKYLGFSFHDTPEVLEEIIAYYPWDFVQLQLNYLDWDFQNAKRQYEIVKAYDLPVIVMEPVRGGTLAILSEESSKILKDYHPEASVASWAIRYAASKEQVMVVLSGMSNLDQTLDNIRTLTHFRPINDEEQFIIDQALKVFLENNTIPCTNCKYCMPCPQGVDIPRIFEIYNQYKLSKFEKQFVYQYLALGEDKMANHCVECYQCVEQCPQSIKIVDQLNEIHQLFLRLKGKHQ